MLKGKKSRERNKPKAKRNTAAIKTREVSVYAKYLASLEHRK